MSTWTIYASPLDRPGRFVVRRFDVVRGEREPVPDEDVSVHFTLQSARNAVPRWADACIPRTTGDDPAIVETWM